MTCSSLGFDKGIELCNRHHNHKIEWFHYTWNALILSLFKQLLSPPPTPGNNWSIPCPCSFAFYMISYEWPHTTCRLLALVLSFSKMKLRLIHGVWINTLFLEISEYYFFEWIYHNLSIYFIEGNLSGFHFGWLWIQLL